MHPDDMGVFELSAPYNWCDRRCERCPLRVTCAAAAAPGRPAAPLPPLPPPLGDERLRRVAFTWAAALDAVAPGDARGVLVVVKIARITWYEAYDDDEWRREAQTVPNLLLLERVLDEVRADVERWRMRAPARPLARFDERDRTLRGLLGPRLAAIADSDRAIVTTLAAAGCAPSPFL